MANSQFRSKRKVSGKRYTAIRKERASDMSGVPALTGVSEKTKIKVKRTMGGNIKTQVLRTDVVYVAIEGKTEKLTIQGVENNPANIHFTRRNVITKGAILKTEKGNVKVTSRPGQDGTISGVLLK